ncbi:4Fe-4S binding protein [Marinifilum caeruleilacunae]|uniref:4Fe-4S binding protein n=1 Tax=Marinifilum caeruleilacunae TaxID=2499076 RepID=A0ABX1WRW3_9BACT|nr:4Fe-4S binding protein [Marinifilum caeruleilacunae]NOU58669.1 4Fe-4S binding protein [Marinifilum caeruleilacunae]
MSKKRVSLFRNILQFSVLSLIILFFIGNQLGLSVVDFETYCPMGGIQAILTLMQDGLIACNMTVTQMVLGAVFLFTVLVLGKLFCSHLCPLGTVSEAIGKAADRFKIRRDINGVTDKALRSLKYILLFFTLTITLKTGELFCKQYDPFYTSITLYGHRVNYLFATISISIFILGSIVFRLFWCKYLCPLGAISNIFKYWIGVGVVVAILGSMYFFEVGVDISIIVGIICLVGYVLEILKVETKQQSVLKITRHTHTCIDCGLCSRSCPQGIDVADMEMVKHPDCNICGDCVSACPKDGALTLNEKLNVKWLPSVLVVVLFIAGLVIASQYNLPTVSKAWGNTTEMDQSKEFTIEHMSHLTCFSSSMGFVRQMKEVDGVLGVNTYISDHKAEITYDTTKIDELSIRKMLYTRSKQFVKAPKLDQELAVHKLRVAKYLTEADLKIMAEALQNEGIYQLETQFDTEIRLLAFCDSEMSESKIEKLITSIKHRRSYPYEVKDVVKSNVPINGIGLMKRTFKKHKATFNNFKSYPREQLRSIMLVLEDFPKNENKFKELSNHVAKKYKGVVGIHADYQAQPTVRFFYIQDKVNPDEMVEWAAKEEMTLVYTNGESEQVANPFKFKLTN